MIPDKAIEKRTEEQKLIKKGISHITYDVREDPNATDREIMLAKALDSLVS